mgnify:CR=1 FL=1
MSNRELIKELNDAAESYLVGDDSKELFSRASAALEAQEWRGIDSAPRDGTLILAGVPDGRIMVWRSDILLRNLNGPTPKHLSFPATKWRPLPDPPTD